MLLSATPTALTRQPTLMRVSHVRMVSTEAPRAARWKPGAVAPAHLTGQLAADVGFDPLLLTALAQKPVMDLVTGGFPNMVQREILLANQSPEQALSSVEWMREAEIKHARLAMLAVVGWPFAELLNPGLGQGGRAPSLFNGGLFDGGAPFFLVLFLMSAAVMENKYEERRLLWKKSGPAGDFGFDPIGFSAEEGPSRRKELRATELYNGRLAMLAITGFAVQEFVWAKPVVQLTPFFFGR